MTTRTKNNSVIDPDHKPEGAHPVKQERSRILRHKVLEFAQSLVIQGRFTTTSMADIARAAGCSVGALYFRFHDKDCERAVNFGKKRMFESHFDLNIWEKRS